MVQTAGGLVIGTLEYSNEFDLWYTRSIHWPPKHVKLMHDHEEAVRWVRDQHTYHTSTP